MKNLVKSIVSIIVCVLLITLWSPQGIFAGELEEYDEEEKEKVQSRLICPELLAISAEGAGTLADAAYQAGTNTVNCLTHPDCWPQQIYSAAKDAIETWLYRGKMVFAMFTETHEFWYGDLDNGDRVFRCGHVIPRD